MEYARTRLGSTAKGIFNSLDIQFKVPEQTYIDGNNIVSCYISI
jgi:hypothetical protein